MNIKNIYKLYTTMAKTKMKRSVGRRRKSGKKTKTRNMNKKRKNVIRGGLPIAVIVTALFAAAKRLDMVPECKSDVTGTSKVCETSYGDSDYIPFIKALKPDQRNEIFDNVIKNKDPGLTGVEWGLLKDIDWTNVNNIEDLNTQYESDIKQKEEGHAARSNTRLDRATAPTKPE